MLKKANQIPKKGSPNCRAGASCNVSFPARNKGFSLPDFAFMFPTVRKRWNVLDGPPAFGVRLVRVNVAAPVGTAL